MAQERGMTFVPMSDPSVFLAEKPDVIIFAVSIPSFQNVVSSFAPHLHENAQTTGRCPLVVDVLSVKEHPRTILLDQMPSSFDIMCTHPMFGPDSGKAGWENLTFMYEPTRVSKQDRAEQFLNIWQTEGCNMICMSAQEHDMHAANSQFITHTVGRILDNQGLSKTPIVLQLVERTTADSFDLFYGLYKFNAYSRQTIRKPKSALEKVEQQLQLEEEKEAQRMKSMITAPRRRIPQWLHCRRNGSLCLLTTHRLSESIFWFFLHICIMNRHLQQDDSK